MTFHTPLARGIRSVRANAPAGIADQLATAFEDFKRRNDGRLDEVQSQIADLAAKAAARGLGGNVIGSDRDTTAINAALRTLIRTGDDSAINALIRPSAGMSVGSDPDGGYSVIPSLSSEMTRRIFEISPIRQLARVVPVSSSSFEEFNDLDEGEAAWVGETQARPETGTPELGMLSIPVREVYAMPKITQKLLDDASIDLAAWLVEKCSTRFARKEGAAFINGDGTLTPRGLLTYPTAATSDAMRPWGTREHVNTGVSGAFGAGTAGSDALIDLVYSLKTEYRPNASWTMNRKTAGVIRKMKDGEGNYLWQASARDGEPDRLLGFRMALDEDMPDIAEDLLSIAFGDFRAGYTIADRHGLRMLRDPYSAKPHVLFYCYKRVGGGVSNFEAIKLLRFGD